MAEDGLFQMDLNLHPNEASGLLSIEDGGLLDAHGWDDFGGAVRADPGLPAVGRGIVPRFDDAVVVGTHQDEVAYRCSATGPPRHQVVGVAVLGRTVAAGEDAAAVAELECGSDSGGDETLGASDVEDFGGSAEDGREEVGVAQQPPQNTGGDGVATGCQFGAQ